LELKQSREAIWITTAALSAAGAATATTLAIDSSNHKPDGEDLECEEGEDCLFNQAEDVDVAEWECGAFEGLECEEEEVEEEVAVVEPELPRIDPTEIITEDFMILERKTG
jgi:hypothetical protein